MKKFLGLITILLVAGCAASGMYVNRHTGEKVGNVRYAECRDEARRECGAFFGRGSMFFGPDDDCGWDDIAVREEECNQRLRARDGWQWVSGD